MEKLNDEDFVKLVERTTKLVKDTIIAGDLLPPKRARWDYEGSRIVYQISHPIEKPHLLDVGAGSGTINCSYEEKDFRCSNCGALYHEKTDYCPDCGHLMDNGPHRGNIKKE